MNAVLAIFKLFLVRMIVSVAVLFSAAVGSASAGTIGISGTSLIFGADDDEQLALSGATSGADLFLDGATFEIVTPGCVVNGTGVRCPLAGFSALTVVGSNLDDAIALGQIFGLDVFVAARDGDDIVVGGHGNDTITGGRGDDILIGGGGLDHLFGGPGNNILLGGGPTNVEPPDPVALPHLQPVPEPATLSLLAIGGLLAGVRRRARR